MNLKDEFNLDYIKNLASQLKKEYAPFKSDLFIKDTINDHWKAKELKERVSCITNNIHQRLPVSYPEQIDILSKVVVQYTGLKGYIFPTFIQTYGLSNYNTSIKAIELFTPYFTAEFAIRPFIEKYPDKTMQQMLLWSTHKNHHLRRLASEGTRPRLPWASPLRAFIENPQPSLPILENLKNDTSEYVRKSVANHLNDISKNHPDLLLSLAKEWYGSSKNTNWIVKHALRTLLKKGNLEALAIFGLADAKELDIEHLQLSHQTIKIGNFIYFEFKLLNKSTKERNIRIEYNIDYVKSNSKTSGKIFQISEFKIAPLAEKSFKRKQNFKELSTRKHYPGIHKISIIVNGAFKESISLVLEP